VQEGKRINSTFFPSTTNRPSMISETYPFKEHSPASLETFPNIFLDIF